MVLPVILTIAGSDPSGGAGIQADLKTIHANGGYALSVLTSVTAQNTRGVRSRFDLPAELVRAQLEAVFDDFQVAAVKTGVLATADTVRTVAAVLGERAGECSVVVDPVMVASAGMEGARTDDAGFPSGAARLLAQDAVEVVRGELLPLATVCTPNYPEAALLSASPAGLAHGPGGGAVRELSGCDSGSRLDRAAIEGSAVAISELGPKAVIITGGHGRGPQSSDLLYDGRRFVWLDGPRLHGKATHGTGCVFSAALATALGGGYSVSEAARRAKQYVTMVLQHELMIGGGRPPADHFCRFRRLMPTEVEELEPETETRSRQQGNDA